MDNIAMREAAVSPEWVIIGLRYFNVYGHAKHTKCAGEHGLSFVQADESRAAAAHFQTRAIKSATSLCKGHRRRSILALEANESGIYNLGCGQARSFNDLVDILNKCLGTNFEPELHRQSARPLPKLHRGRLEPEWAARLVTRRNFRWKTACAIT